MAVVARLIPTCRRTQPVRPSTFLLSLQAAVRGKVHGVGRAGAAGGLLWLEAGAHGASLFFLLGAGIANGHEFFATLRKGVCS